MITGEKMMQGSRFVLKINEMANDHKYFINRIKRLTIDEITLDQYVDMCEKSAIQIFRKEAVSKGEPSPTDDEIWDAYGEEIGTESCSLMKFGTDYRYFKIDLPCAYHLVIEVNRKVIERGFSEDDPDLFRFVDTKYSPVMLCACVLFDAEGIMVWGCERNGGGVGSEPVNELRNAIYNTRLTVNEVEDAMASFTAYAIACNDKIKTLCCAGLQKVFVYNESAEYIRVSNLEYVIEDVFIGADREIFTIGD